MGGPLKTRGVRICADEGVGNKPMARDVMMVAIKSRPQRP